MNEENFIDIPVLEAFELLLRGQTAYTTGFTEYRLNEESVLERRAFGHNSWLPSTCTFNHMLSFSWLKPRPFCPRKAMIEQTGEWVGMYIDKDGRWMKLGFNEKSMQAVAIPLGSTRSVFSEDAVIPSVEEINSAIPYTT